jgi:hypothetical protein
VQHIVDMRRLMKENLDNAALNADDGTLRGHTFNFQFKI